MLTVRQLLESIRPEDWMKSVDLMDAYFHVPIISFSALQGKTSSADYPSATPWFHTPFPNVS